MISQSDLHAITDAIGAQIYQLRTYLGEDVDSLAGSATTICESLFDCNETLIAGGDQDSIKDLSGSLQSAESALDWQNIARRKYGNILGRLNTHLKNLSGTIYSGYSYFAIENTGTRYCSEFARVLTLLGINFAGAAHIFYDRDDSLGTFDVTGSGVGTWTAATSPFASGITHFGVQPSSALETIASGAIGAADITVEVMATDIYDTDILLTTTIAALSADGTKDALTGGATENFIKSIKWVQCGGGTNGDQFTINFNPIRDIAL